MEFTWNRIGANINDEGVEFRVWAPLEETMSILLDNAEYPMERHGEYFSKVCSDCGSGNLYRFRVGGTVLPDPASRFQPEGISGPSSVVDLSAYKWRETEWKGMEIDDMIIYELHVGTFTGKGTYDGVVDRLGHLLDLGINTVEIMPVNQTYGSRNWGYDGVFPFAPMYSYGSPGDLKHMVDSLHSAGLSVILDVVYNHLGPLGNVFQNFGPYFNDNYRNPWGKAINYDSSYSGGVREFFLCNALYWLENFRFDGLRLDATHSIFDQSPRHFLHDLENEVRKLSGKTGRKIVLIAENDRNDVSVIRERKRCGYGMNGVWSDDLHHSLHAYLAGESNGYYEDYGDRKQIFKALKDGFVYDGTYSKHLRKNRGTKFAGEDPSSLVVCLQNHDQVGNRALGDRFSSLVDLPTLKLASAAVLLSPFTPMLFMGEEYAESSPFLFFVDPPDREFALKIRKGRKNEFREFGFDGRVPDPSSLTSFTRSKLSWKTGGLHSRAYAYYSSLVSLRKRYLSPETRRLFTADSTGSTIAIRYRIGDRNLTVLLNLEPADLELGGNVLLNSSTPEFGGSEKARSMLRERGAAVVTD